MGGIWDILVDKANLFTTSVAGTIFVWDKRVWEPVRQLAGHKGNIQRLAQDERYLYSISTDKSLIIWDKISGDTVRIFKKVFARGLLGVACTDEHVIALSKAQGLKIWRKDSWGSQPTELPGLCSNRAIVDDQRVWLGHDTREELGL